MRSGLPPTDRTEKEDLSYRALFEAHPQPMWVYERDTLRILAVNDAAVAEYGYARNEFLTMSIRDLRPPDDVPALLDRVADISEGLRGSGIWRHRRKNGEVLMAEITSHTVPFRGRPAVLVMAENVTDRLASDKALRRAEVLLGVAGRAARLGGWSVDLASRRLEWSDEVCAIHDMPPGYSPTVEEGIAFYAPEYRDRIKTAFEACALEGTPFDEEMEIITPKQGRVWVRSIGEAVRDEQGHIVQVQGAFQNISDKKQTELSLHESNEKFRQLADLVPQIIWTADPEGNVDFASRTFYDHVGSDNIDLKAGEWLEAIHPDDRERCAAAWSYAISTGRPLSIELRIYRDRDKSYRWHLVSSTPVRGEGGIIVKWFGAASDMHDRKIAVESLRENERRLRAIFEHEPECVTIVSADGALADINPAGLLLLEAESPDLVNGRQFAELVHPEDRKAYVTLHEEASCGTSNELSFRIIGLNGTERTVEMHATPLPQRGATKSAVLSISRDVTARRQAEATLSQTRQEFQLILSSIGEGVHGVDASGKIRFENPAALAMLGWTKEELLGANAHERIHHHRADGSPYPNDDCPIYRTSKDGIVRRVDDEVFFRKDGHSFPVEYVCSPVKDKAGTTTSTVVAFRDISERKRNEQIQRAESRILEMISSGAPLRIVLEGVTLAIEELFPETIASILLLDDDGVHVRRGAAPHLPDAFSDAIEGEPIGPNAGSCGTAMYRREQIVVTDIATDPLWEHYRETALGHDLRACWSTPVIDTVGTVLASFAMYYREPRAPTDDALQLIARVTHLVRIAIENNHRDELLRASEARFFSIARATADVVWDWDLIAGTVWWSDDYYTAFGFSPGEIKSVESWTDHIHPDDRPRITEGVQNAIVRKAEFWSDEYRYLRSDGTVIEIEDRGCLILDRDGNPVRFVGGMTEITERKRAQRELRERIKELRCVYRALALTTNDSRPTEAICAEIATILPASTQHDDVAVARVGIDTWEHQSEGWREPVATLRATVRSGANEIGFLEIGYSEERPDQQGGEGPFLAEERALLDAIAAHIGRMFDNRRMAETLSQSERLRAIGELTGGIAHDFNNLLTVILGNAELLSERLAEDPTSKRLADMAEAAAQRGADLTSRLLAFARKQALDPKITDVGQLVLDMEDLLRRTIGEHIEIEIIQGEELWPALVDAPQLENAVLNLCINARDAMPEGGKLIVEIANTRLVEADAEWSEDLVPGDYVGVVVSDTGTGMTPEVLSHAFEPFYTTKEVGQGSGLGLSMVFGFVKQSNGDVRIDSAPGQGTAVRIYLPRAEAEAVAEEEAAIEMEAPGGRERILLVEDDDLVRDHVTGQLLAMGYRVISARNGVEAIEILNRGESVDLLFTDVVMPGGISGRDLADQAQHLRPDLPILFTSGYSEDAIVHDGRLDRGVHLLNKPYRRQELADKLRFVLDEGARAGNK